MSKSSSGESKIKGEDFLIRRKSKSTSPSAEEHPGRSIRGNDGRLLQMDINIVNPDPNQPRKNFKPEALQELSESIKKNGVLQPIIVREDGDKCWIVAGERRYRAAKMAGLEKIPALITIGDPVELALIENIQREDLNPIEEAEGYKHLMETHNYSQSELGAIINKAQSKVSELLSLNGLPEEIRKGSQTFDISKSLLIELAKQPEKKLPKLYQQAKDGTLTVAKLRKASKKQETRGRKQSSPEELALKKLHDFDKSIKKIEKSNLSQENKDELWQKFNEVYNFLNALVN